MTDKQDTPGMPTRVERINPYLHVADIPTSTRYYIDVFGFELYVETPNLSIIQWDGHQVHLVKSAPGCGPNLVWLGVENIEVLYERYKAKGVRFIEEPANYSWAYQMKVEDPDGNMLIFGAGPKEDMPFED